MVTDVNEERESVRLREYALRQLEFTRILELLWDKASSTLGQEAVQRLKPSTSFQIVKRRLALTSEMRQLMDVAPPPLGGIRQLERTIFRAEKGALLAPEDFLAVADSLRAARKIRQHVYRHRELCPALWERVQEIEQDRELEEDIERCIDPAGDVADRASRELGRIRGKIRARSEELRRRLDEMVKGGRYRSVLQDALITQRSGRFVLPVRQEYRGRVEGIVHGQSASGATLFIEPQFAVQLNNEIQTLRSEEEREVTRILHWLGQGVKGAADRLRREQEILGAFDLLFAKASLSEEMDAVAPHLKETPELVLHSARHPLLQVDVVPVDVEIGRTFHTLVITGPNTGGKTVTLKTVGLLVLMCQAGLHIPCGPESEVGMFEEVLCDIGDEQSIAQNLSTFSAHMRNVIPIVKRVTPESLVLLDELGAGTDPAEGAPLAMSILHELHFRQVRTVATTHFSQLKSFAYLVEGAANASVEFDVETLSPTYRLLMGMPGRSNALEIAGRLGLDPGVIERARSFMDDEGGDLNELFEAIAEDRDVWEEERHRAEDEARDAEKMRKRLERREAYLKRVQEDIVAEARRKARTLLEETREEANSALREIHRLAGELKALRQEVIDKDAADQLVTDAEKTRARVARLRDSLNEKLTGIRDQYSDEESKAKPEPEGPPADLQVGSHVKIPKLDQTGYVEDVDWDREQAHVRIGAVKMWVDLKDLNDAPDPVEEETRARIQTISRNKGEHFSDTLNIRQHTVDEALPRVTKHLDDALLAGRTTITIIHGHGTGALRSAVRKYLDEHPQITSWRPGGRTEGGDGVTVAHLQ